MITILNSSISMFRFQDALMNFTGSTLWQLYKIKFDVNIY